MLEGGTDIGDENYHEYVSSLKSSGEAEDSDDDWCMDCFDDEDAGKMYNLYANWLFNVGNLLMQFMAELHLYKIVINQDKYECYVYKNAVKPYHYSNKKDIPIDDVENVSQKFTDIVKQNEILFFVFNAYMVLQVAMYI